MKPERKLDDESLNKPTAAPPIAAESISHGMRDLLKAFGHISEESAEVDAFREVNLPDPIDVSRQMDNLDHDQGESTPTPTKGTAEI